MTQPATLQSVLEKSFQKQTDNMFTSIPGIVVYVRNKLSSLSVDVQPAINIVREDGTETEVPTILNVPVSMPVNFEGGLTHPLKAGDSVYLIFSMRGIDLWKRGDGSLTRPSDYRKFNIKDCVAIPIQTFSKSVNNPLLREWPHSTDDVVLFHNVGTGRECEIRLKPSGDVVINTNHEVTVNANKVEVNASEDAVVNANKVEVNANQEAVVNANKVEVNSQTTDVYSPQSTFYGNVQITGTATIDVDAVIGGISFIGHTHGISSGSSAPGPTLPPTTGV